MPTEYGGTIDTETWGGPPTYDQLTRVGGANKSDALRVGSLYAGPPTHNDATSYLHWSGGGGVTYRNEMQGDWPGPVGSVSRVDKIGRAHV